MFCHHPPMIFRKWFPPRLQPLPAPAGGACLSFNDGPGPEGTPFFRPSRIRHLKEKYTIVLWDVITGDHSPRQTLQKISRRLEKYMKACSVIVRHGQANYS